MGRSPDEFDEPSNPIQYFLKYVIISKYSDMYRRADNAQVRING